MPDTHLDGYLQLRRKPYVPVAAAGTTWLARTHPARKIRLGKDDCVDAPVGSGSGPRSDLDWITVDKASLLCSEVRL